jgi:hypothetical protein
VALKTCKLSCSISVEQSHAVGVSAGSVYKAVAQALRIFRDNDWIDDIGHGQTLISIKVKHPEIEHTARMRDFERLVGSEPQFTARVDLEESIIARAVREGQLILPAQSCAWR